MSMSSASLERRLRALEAERASRHPERLLVLLGINEIDTAAQFAQLVRDGRADAAEPFQSILMVPGVGTREAIHAQTH